MIRVHHIALSLCLYLCLCPSARAESEQEGLRDDYLRYLDEGSTPSTLIAHTLKESKWRVIDPSEDPIQKLKAGDRVVFINQERTALYVVIGKQSLAQVGARIVASHIDTPSPRLFLGNLDKGNQHTLMAGAHGGIKGAHWLRRPLRVRGQVIKSDGKRVDIELGDTDDFSFFIEESSKGDYQVIASSTPTSDAKMGSAQTIVALLHERYGISADDLRSSELYLVPKMKSRAVGIESMIVGSHGQDDRANSFLAWRAISELDGTPTRSAISWLVDREESGSRGRAGARSGFLELVYSYILRSQGGSVSELDLMRAFAKSEGLSADTPACVNPNWPEVHEKAHGPLLGKGPVMFPGTGHGGKMGGSQAHAELVGAALATFARVRVPVQRGELGRVDEGGGGTIAKYIEDRGIDMVDIGVCVVGMHSPFELSSVQDLWWGLRGFEAWLSGS